MPELPEVETIKNRLVNLVVGKPIVNIQVLRDKSFRGDPDKLIGLQFIKVTRRAKIINFHLAQNIDQSKNFGLSNLLIHLKMTGQLIYVDENTKVGGGHPTADWVNDLPSKHTRVIIQFVDKSNLFFNDMRVFGWVWLMDKDLVEQEFSKYGPDINDPSLGLAYLIASLKNRRIPIKQAIMDNKVIAGVGNIYASEALFVAGVHPQRPANSLREEEMSKLFIAMQKVIDRSIKLGGTTFDGKYVGVDGFAGGFQNELQVYGQNNKQCPNCGSLIKRIKLGGRGTFFCERCQS